MNMDETQLNSLKDELYDLKREVKDLHDRNARVDLNKKWETSITRLVAVAIITYVTMILVFIALGSGRPTVEALVPTAGFILSTQSLTVVRALWEKLQGRKARSSSSQQRAI